MASVHRRPNSRFWRAAWRGPDGKLRARSTKFTSRSKALRLAIELERLDRGLRAGAVAEMQAQRIVSDLVREMGAEPTEVPTVRSWFNGWLREREEHIAEATRVNYDKAVRDLLEHLKSDAERPLPSLTTGRLQAWVNELTKRGLAPGTVKIYLEPIRAGVTRAWKRGLIPADVAADIERPKGQAAEKDAFTQAEIDALLGAADPEWRFVILLGAYTGMSISDAAGLTWGKIDLLGGVIRYRRKKSKVDAPVPIHPRLRAALESASGDEPDAPLCPSLRGLGTSGTHGLSGQFSRLMKRAGIVVERRGDGKRKVANKSAHSLRHTFVRRLLAAGVDEAVRMKLSAHKTKAAHHVYAQADLDMLRKAVEALP